LVSLFPKKQTDEQGEKEKYVYWQIEVIRSLYKQEMNMNSQFHGEKV
jgi:hypothetical protein